MNQDVHILATILSKDGELKDKDQVMEFVKKDLGAVGILDSYRCWMPRQVTHFTKGSYWKMPTTLEELKKSKKEDMKFYLSDFSKQMIAKKSCVDETILIKNLIRNNLEMFSNESNENYGILVLAHALQDFYTDEVWRLIYNFNNQTEVILKTESEISGITSFLDSRNTDNSKKTQATYHLLRNNVQDSDHKFREDYRAINCFVSYLLSKQLEKRGYVVWEDEDNNIFKEVQESYEALYPQEVFDSCRKYVNYLPETRECMEKSDARALDEQIKEIFGENYDGLFGKMLENLLISYGEARDNVY